MLGGRSSVPASGSEEGGTYVESAVIDAEVVAYDRENKRLMPFQARARVSACMFRCVGKA